MSAAAGTVARRYRSIQRRRLSRLLGLALAVLAAFVLDLVSGPAGLGLAQIWAGLWQPESLGPGEAVILWELRLPVAWLAVLVGAALGASGAEMQTVLDNPLASPYTLGMAAAASCGAALMVHLGLERWTLGPLLGLPLGALAGALLAAGLLLVLARRFGEQGERLLLFGVALMFAFEALLGLLQFAAEADAVQQLVFWNLGSLNRASWDKLALLAGVLAIALGLAWRDAWSMTCLRAGMGQAESLGLDVAALRRRALWRISLLSAVALAFAGTIGFIGLVGPHLARLLLGEDHRYLVPGSALAGALMLSLASLASKSLLPGSILPVGIVTALVGVPLLLVLLYKSGGRP